MGFDRAFATSVRGHLVPGTSALFAFGTDADGGGLASTLPPGARELARLVLTAEQYRRLHTGFDE